MFLLGLTSNTKRVSHFKFVLTSEAYFLPWQHEAEAPVFPVLGWLQKASVSYIGLPILQEMFYHLTGMPVVPRLMD